MLATSGESAEVPGASYAGPIGRPTSAMVGGPGPPERPLARRLLDIWRFHAAPAGRSVAPREEREAHRNRRFPCKASVPSLPRVPRVPIRGTGAAAADRRGL